MTMTHLLQRAQSGDETAVQDLVQAYGNDLYRLARSVLGDPQEAEEAVQDALLAALRARDSYRGEAALKTWLYAITLNGCRRRLQKRRARELLLKTVHALFRGQGVGLAHPEEALIRREARAELWAAVDALGDKHRLPLLLFYEHELSVAEIAQTLGLPAGTVLSRLHTARQRLRGLLDEQPETPLEAGNDEPD